MTLSLGRYTATSIALCALTAALAGCDALGPDREILLPITRLDAPASVEPSGTLVAQITVQFGGCRSFDRLVTTRAADRVTIRAIGHDGSSRKVSCPGDIREQTVEYRANGPFTDPFLVIGIQPDGEETRRTVRLLTP
jgi:hypothetical protein